MAIATTDRVQALEALEIAEKVYTRFGYQSLIQDQLLAILIREAADEDEAKANAEEFRNLLWSYFSGGGVSADVTRRVYAALGRENETDSRWI